MLAPAPVLESLLPTPLVTVVVVAALDPADLAVAADPFPIHQAVSPFFGIHRFFSFPHPCFLFYPSPHSAVHLLANFLPKT